MYHSLQIKDILSLREVSMRRLVDLFSIEYVRFKNLSGRTEEGYRTAVASLLNVIGEVTSKQITSKDIKEWHNYMLENNYAMGTIRSHLSRIKNLFEWSNSKGLTNFPVNDIIYPKTTITPPRFVTTEDVSQMIKVTTKGRDKAVISLLYASGLRSSELSGLNRSSLTGNQLQILGKGHKYRLGFIDARTAFLIATYLDGRNDNLAPLFITNRGTRLEKEIIARIVKTAVLSAGLDESVTPHTLRHGYATNLLRNGCNLRYIQELLGHSNIQTTMLYTHVLDDDLSTNYKRYHSI